MTAAERDVERTDLDVRVEAEDRDRTMPDPVQGADVAAHRTVLERIAVVYPGAGPAEFLSTTGAERDSARRIAVEVLVEAVDEADGALDPYVYVGSVAAGIVRALRDLGAVPR